MSADTFAGRAGELDVGKAIGAGFIVVGKRWQTYLACALILCLLNMVTRILTAVPHQVGGASAAYGVAGGRFLLWSMARLFVIQPPIVSLMIWTTCADAAGTPADLGAAVAAVGRQLGRLLLVNAVLTFALIVGMLFLLIPGIWLSVVFAVAMPACLVEGMSPEDALRRSFAITRGQRWRVLGFSLLVGLIMILGGIGMWLIAMVLRVSSAFALVPGLAGVPALEQGLMGALIPAFTGSLYVALLRLEGGLGEAQIAELFA